MKSKPEIVVIGAAIVDLPLYPVGRDVFDRASSPVERMAMTVGGDAINEATILTRLGHTVRLVRQAASYWSTAAKIRSIPPSSRSAGR